MVGQDGLDVGDGLFIEVVLHRFMVGLAGPGEGVVSFTQLDLSEAGLDLDQSADVGVVSDFLYKAAEDCTDC